MKRSRRFYEEVFGFTYDRELLMQPPELQPLLQLEPPSSIHATYLQLDLFTLELMEWDPPAGTAAGSRRFLETGLTHISIVVDDVGASIAKVRNHGGTVLSDIGRAAMVRDPDGQLIELIAPEVHQETMRGRRERAAGRGDQS